MNNKTISGFKWSFIDTIVNLLAQVVIVIILARLLSPLEFGLIGMSFVFITIAKGLADSGLYQALIQKKNPTSGDYVTVWKFNMTVAIVLFVVILLSAQSIANFYDNDDIKIIVQVLSVIILLDAFSVVQRAYMVKNINFFTIAKINVITKVFSGTTAIILAYTGFGVWSLVAKEVLFALTASSLYWIYSPVKFNFKEKSNDLKKLFGFGSKVFLADQIEIIGNQIVNLIIGKKYTPADLGLFRKAEQLQNIFSQTLVVSINKVTFPTLSAIQDDDQKLKSTYRDIIRIICVVLVPLLMTAILIGENLVLFLLGNQWEMAILYFQILCVGGIAYPFTVLNLNILKVKNRPGLYLNISILSKGLLLPFVFVGLLYGITGLVISFVAHRFLAAVINSYFSGELIDYSLLNQLGDVIRIFIITGIVFTGIWFLKDYATEFIGSGNHLILIFTTGGLFAFFYSTLLFFVDNKSFKLGYGLILGMIGAKK